MIGNLLKVEFLTFGFWKYCTRECAKEAAKVLKMDSSTRRFILKEFILKSLKKKYLNLIIRILPGLENVFIKLFKLTVLSI